MCKQNRNTRNKLDFEVDILSPNFILLFISSNNPIVFFDCLFNKLGTFQIKGQIYANVDLSLFLYEGSIKDFVCKMRSPPVLDSEMEEERKLLFLKLQD